MSGIEISRLAWDSCIFLAWFKGEEDKPLAEIEELLADIAKGRITLIVSAIVAAEILDESAGSPVRNKFREFMKRSNVVAANADFRVADLAADIRERTRELESQGKMKKSVKAPDAMILASAIIYRAEVLHTFDPILLSLDQSEVVHRLRITVPISAQTRLC